MKRNSKFPNFPLASEIIMKYIVSMRFNKLNILPYLQFLQTSLP